MGVAAGNALKPVLAGANDAKPLDAGAAGAAVEPNGSKLSKPLLAGAAGVAENEVKSSKPPDDTGTGAGLLEVVAVEPLDMTTWNLGVGAGKSPKSLLLMLLLPWPPEVLLLVGGWPSEGNPDSADCLDEADVVLTKKKKEIGVKNAIVQSYRVGGLLLPKSLGLSNSSSKPPRPPYEPDRRFSTRTNV